MMDRIVVMEGSPRNPGELGKMRCIANDGAVYWEWKLVCPKCGKAAYLDHAVHEDAVDGTVTIHPSVICAFDCGAHFHIVNNQIQWLE